MTRRFELAAREALIRRRQELLTREATSGRPARTQQIRDILAALDRVDRGTYGLCDRCLRPIEAERLEAMPWARRCVACAGAPD